MRVQRGDVILVDFQFSDGTGSKMRPAVVVQCDADNQRLGSVIVSMITKRTQLVGREPRHVLIDIGSDDGRSAGLSYNLVVNCLQLATVQIDRVARRLGHLSPSLIDRVSGSLKQGLEL